MGYFGVLLGFFVPCPHAAYWYAGVVYPLYLLRAATSMVAAYGLLTERPWVRSLLTRWAAALFIVTTIVCSSLTELGLHVLIVKTWRGWALLGMSFWYFYRYAPVRRYYDRLSQGSPAPLQA